MNNFKDFPDVADTTVPELKTEKTESILLLKQKMCKTNDLIKQYTEKIKEIERLKLDLELSKKDNKHMTCQYKSLMNMTRELELAIVDAKSKIADREEKINEYLITIAADKQNIQQLTCKIREMKEQYCAKLMEYDLQKSSHENKIKELEHDIKVMKKSEFKKKKEVDSFINNNTTNPIMKTKSKSIMDVSTNVLPCDLGLNTKPEVQDKHIMTDEFYNIKDDPYPLFCAKCEVHLSPAPIDKICKLMTQYPALIEPLSPPRNLARPRKSSLPSPLLSPLPPPLLHPPPNKEEHLDTDKEMVSSEVLPMLCPVTSVSKDNRLTDNDPKHYLEEPYVTPQNFENVELTNEVNLTNNKSIETSSLDDHSDKNFTTTSLSDINNTKREDLSIEDSPYIKEMKKSIQSLERKMKKQLQRMKEINISRSYCNHQVTNCNHDAATIDVNQFIGFFKTMMDFHLNTNKKSMHFQNKRNIKSRIKKKQMRNTKKVKLKRLKRCTSESSWDIEGFDNKPIRHKLRTISKITEGTSTQSGRELSCVNQDNSSFHTSNEMINIIPFNVFDKDSYITEVASIGDDSMISMNIDEIHDDHNDSNNHKKQPSSDFDCKIQTTKETQLPKSKSESTVNHYDCDNRIAGANAKKGGKNQNKRRTGDSLMKKLRNLKRNIQACSQPCLNQQKDNTELSSTNDSQYPILAKKQRIAHISKKTTLQSDFSNKEPADYTAENVTGLETSSSQQFNAHIRRDSAPMKMDCKKNEKRNECNSVTECSETHDTVKGLIHKENSKAARDEGSSCNTDNSSLFASSLPDVESNRLDSVSVKHGAIGGNESKERKIETFSECNRSDLSCNNTINDFKKTVPSNSFHKDSKYSENILMSRLYAKERNKTSNKITPIINVQSFVKKTRIEAMKCQNLFKSQETSTATESQLSCVEIQEDVPALVPENQKCDEISAIIQHINTHNVENFKDEEELPDAEVTENCVKKTCDNIPNEMERDNINSCEIISRLDSDLFLSDEEDQTKSVNTLDDKDDIEMDDGDIENNDDDRDDDNDDNDVNNDDCYCNDYNRDDDDDDDVSNSGNNNGDNDCDNDNDDGEENYIPMSQLNKYIKQKTVNSTNKSQRKRKRLLLARNIYITTDMFIKSQLQRLVDNDWSDDIHHDVLDKLSNLCGPRIIAKCVVEFLLSCSNGKHDLDKSFTPPAPVMLKFEQKVTALLVDLEQLKPTVVTFVQAGIQYKLFSLSSKFQICEVETLSRIFVTLARIQNNREMIRMMCCDALYCLGVRAINVLYVILTCWPDVFPNVAAAKGVLPKCIAFLIIIQKADNYQKLFPLKSLITSYYNYDREMNTKDITEELMTALEDKQEDGLETAIILVAKRNGTLWTYGNIIESCILPTIIEQKYPCMFSAFSLLGKLLRTFPLKSKDNTIRDICEQLSDILKSNKVSDNEEEGVTSALLSLSRHEFKLVAASVMRWTPKKPLRPSTIAQLNNLIKSRQPQFWKKFFKIKEQSE